MTEGWLEESLAEHDFWHISSLKLNSGVFGPIPVSIRVIAVQRNPGRNDTERVFAPQITPLILIFAVPAKEEGAPKTEIMDRLQARLRLRSVVVKVNTGATNPVSGLKIIAGENGLTGGDGERLAKWVADVLMEEGITIDHAARGQKPLNTGKTKDLLHLWSRELLSSELIVNDIDALCFTGPDKPLTLVEIKRSGVIPWEPYAADASNYALLRALSTGAGSDVFDLTIHYDPGIRKPPYKVTPHFVVGTSLRNGRRIVGLRLDPLHGETPSQTSGEVANFVKQWTERAYWSSN